MTDGDYDDGDPDWSPDGKTIAFASDRTDDRWKWPGASIWTLNLASGALTRMTDEALSCHAPKWSPDGKTIAFLATHAARAMGIPISVLYPRIKPCKHRQLTTDFVPNSDDTCIDDMRAGHGGAHLAWSPDGHYIFFLASMRGATHVYAARPRATCCHAASPKARAVSSTSRWTTPADGSRWPSPIPTSPAISTPRPLTLARRPRP